jgi:protein SCO1/2
MIPTATYGRTLRGWLISACLCTLSACSGLKKPPDTTDRLPFFNTPDWTARWIEPSDAGYDSIHRIPSFRLTDQLGRAVTEKELEGRITIANFFFTRCKGICPRMSLNTAYLQEAFRNDPDILLLSHSVDPEADSVPVLAAYAAAHEADPDRWRLLTGDRELIYRLARKEYFAGDTIGLSAAGTDFLHTEDMILLDGRRRIRGLYNGTLRSEMDRIREDIAILKKE